MLFLLNLCLLYLIQVDGCEIYKDGLTWTLNPEKDDLIPDIDTFERCAEECKKKHECTAFTWEEAGPVNICFVFENPTEVVSCESCRSGLAVKVEHNKGCSLDPEHILLETIAGSVQECMGLCINTTECTNYLYFNEHSILTNFCYLYNICNEVMDCEHCESGKFNCFEEDLPPECSNYMVLDDPTRSDSYFKNESEGEIFFCDQNEDFADFEINISPDWQGPGWYRLQGEAGEIIPERHPGANHCGTRASGWANTTHPTEAGEQKNMTVCFDFDSEDCHMEAQIMVTHCQDFYVYNLVDAPWCDYRYCGTSIN